MTDTTGFVRSGMGDGCDRDGLIDNETQGG